MIVIGLIVIVQLFAILKQIEKGNNLSTKDRKGNEYNRRY